MEWTPEIMRQAFRSPMKEWTMPPYKSPEFFAILDNFGITLEQFKKMQVYQHAVKTGLIVNDEWAGKA